MKQFFRVAVALWLAVVGGVQAAQSPVEVSFRTVAEMQAFTVYTWQTNLIANVSASGQGGTFYWTSAGTADNGVTFAGTTGFWNRQDADKGMPYDIRWYGAVGDGVTDDTSEITATLTAAVLAGVNKVKVPDGTFLVSTLTISQDSVSVFGPGTIKKSDSLDPILTITGDNVTLDGVGFDGNVSNITPGGNSAINLLADAIFANGADNLTIKNCDIRNTYASGIEVRNCKSPRLLANYIHDLGSTNKYQAIDAIFLYGPTNYSTVGTVVSGNHISRIMWEVNDKTWPTFPTNLINNGARDADGIQIQGVGTADPDLEIFGTIISDNVIEYCPARAVKLQSGGAIVQNNTIRECGGGVRPIGGGKYLQGHHIIANHFFKVGDVFDVSGGNHRDLYIAQNDVYDATTIMEMTSAATITRLILDNNTFSNVRSYILAAASTTPLDNVVMTGNRIVNWGIEPTYTDRQRTAIYTTGYAVNQWFVENNTFDVDPGVSAFSAFWIQYPSRKSVFRNNVFNNTGLNAATAESFTWDSGLNLANAELTDNIDLNTTTANQTLVADSSPRLRSKLIYSASEIAAIDPKRYDTLIQAVNVGTTNKLSVQWWIPVGKTNVPLGSVTRLTSAEPVLDYNYTNAVRATPTVNDQSVSFALLGKATVGQTYTLNFQARGRTYAPTYAFTNMASWSAITWNTTTNITNFWRSHSVDMTASTVDAFALLVPGLQTTNWVEFRAFRIIRKSEKPTADNLDVIASTSDTDYVWQKFPKPDPSPISVDNLAALTNTVVGSDIFNKAIVGNAANGTNAVFQRVRVAGEDVPTNEWDVVLGAGSGRHFNYTYADTVIATNNTDVILGMNITGKTTVGQTYTMKFSARANEVTGIGESTTWTNAVFTPNGDLSTTMADFTIQFTALSVDSFRVYRTNVNTTTDTLYVSNMVYWVGTETLYPPDGTTVFASAVDSNHGWKLLTTGWDNLSGVPAGFADGIDNTGVGGSGDDVWVNHADVQHPNFTNAAAAEITWTVSGTNVVPVLAAAVARDAELNSFLDETEASLLYQKTNSVLTTLGGIGAGTTAQVIWHDGTQWTNSAANPFQATNANLTAWQALATAAKQDAFTTGVGVTNVANVLSGNYTPGTAISFATNANGAVAISSTATGAETAGTVHAPDGATTAKRLTMFKDTTGTNITQSPILLSGTGDTNASIPGLLYVDSIVVTNGITSLGSGVNAFDAIDVTNSLKLRSLTASKLLVSDGSSYITNSLLTESSITDNLTQAEADDLFQGTNSVLTTLAGIGAGTAGQVIWQDGTQWTNSSVNPFQATNANLTAWQALATSAKQDADNDLLRLATISSASGDVLYRDATGWTNLAKGSDSEVLKLVSGFPSWETDSTGSGGDSAYANGTAISDSFSLTNTAASATVASTTWSVSAQADPDPDRVSVAIGPASATDAGIVTANSQTFAGAKDFAGGLAVGATNIITALAGKQASGSYLTEASAYSLYQGTNSVLTTLAGIGAGTAGAVIWRDGTQWTNSSVNPFQSTNSVLTTLAGIGAGTAGQVIWRDATQWTNTGVNPFQATNGNLTTLANASITGAGNFMRTRTGVYREIWIPANAFNPPASGAPSFRTNTWATTTDGQAMEVYDFDADADESLQVLITLPTTWDAADPKIKIFWKPVLDQDANEDVMWGAVGGSLTDDETGGNTLGTPATVQDTDLQSTNKVHITSALTVDIGGSPAAGHFVWLKVYRDADNGTDDMENDASLIGVQLQYLESATEPSAW